MELDHVFVFTEEHERLANALRNFGLNEGTPNVHRGQGTACRRFFFQNAYLELVWVTEQYEIENAASAKARFLERSQYHVTNHCPLGFCFRTTKQMGSPLALLFDESWRYYSEFLPEGQFANIASNEDFLTEPLLFEMPLFGLAPKDYLGEKMQPLVHPTGFKEITEVSLTLPENGKGSSNAMKKVLNNSVVTVLWKDHYEIALEFGRGEKGESQGFYPLAPLTFNW